MHFSSKAFDVVPHKCLIEKLLYYGIKCPCVVWMDDFLKNRSQRVVVVDDEFYWILSHPECHRTVYWDQSFSGFHQ